MIETTFKTDCTYHLPIFQDCREELFVKCLELHKKNPNKTLFNTSNYCINCHLREGRQ